MSRRTKRCWMICRAWLSRNTCALVGDGTLVLLLPGSPKAVAQGMEILGPLLPHALAMMRGLPHA